MKVKLYVEGGGDSKELHVRCREGFRKLLEKAGFSGRMPSITACGGRGSAFDDFKQAVRVCAEGEYPILLIDSEGPIDGTSIAWRHLQTRDSWERPLNVNDDQAQLMVTCMETWIIADRLALTAFFGAALQDTALLPTAHLEVRHRDEVQNSLERATRNCGRDGAYCKGKRSFAVLSTLNPATLIPLLPHFDQFISTLKRHL
ncbi:MAG: DUF4276 family protein [Armatimonadota bacterium]